MKQITPILFSASLLLCLFLSACTHEDELVDREKVIIAYAEAITNVSPLGFEAKDRQFLNQIYEPLLRYDSSFNFETALAVSWGRLDEMTWQFRLRDDVFFHDGTELDAGDVVYSLEMAMNDSSSELSSLLANIGTVKAVDDLKLEIQTKTPDPLLLNKLVSVYVFPQSYVDFEVPNGSSAYFLSEYSSQHWLLTRNDSYWGDAAFFDTAELRVVSSVEDREDQFISGEIDFLVNVPPSSSSAIENVSGELIEIPSLEVSYLMMNLDGVLSDDILREIVWSAIDSNYAESLGGGYLVDGAQFGAKGIMGYINQFESRARELLHAVELRIGYEGDTELSFIYPEGLDALAELVQGDLEEVDLNVELISMSPELYEEAILSGEYDLYFFGWKFELADVSDFYETVVHTPDGDYGSFNGLGYSNDFLDELIEESSVTLDVLERQILLATILENLYADKVILPLFESKVLYAHQEDIYWALGLDSQVLASEIMK